MAGTFKALYCSLKETVVPLAQQLTYLVEAHLEGKSLIQFIGHGGAVDVEQHKSPMVCNDASPLIVYHFQLVPLVPGYCEATHST